MILPEVFKVLIYRFHTFLKPISCILLLIILHYGVQRDVVKTTYSLVLYSLHHNCVFNLKMACKAKICRGW